MRTKHSAGRWDVLSSEVVYSAPPWVSLALDTVRLPDGRLIERYHQVTLPDFVIIVATTPDGRLIVERAYKHGVGHVTLVLPAGMREKEEDPIVCGRRELLEETGYGSDDWRLLGEFVENGTYRCGTASVLRARDVRRLGDPAPGAAGDLEQIETLLMTPQEVARAIASGEMVTMNSVAAFALATNALLTVP